MPETEFLPKDYIPPRGSSGFMKLEKGTNKFLILASALIGWEYWNLEGKPVRVKELPEHIPTDIQIDDEGQPVKIKHFWAFPVWNYEDERVQVLELTQVTIQREITALVHNEDWGSPVLTYAITVSREGERLDTVYTVTPSPVKDIPIEITNAWKEVKEKGFEIARLMIGGNPFSEDKK